MQRRPPLLADPLSRVIAGTYVTIGAANATLGPVSDELRSSLGLSGAVTGLHGAMFGWFLLLSGLASARLLRLPDAALFRVGIGAAAAGLVVLAAGHHVGVTLAGAALLGAGSSLLVLVVPPLVSAVHGPEGRAAVFTFVNALSMMGSIASPLVLAATLRGPLGWRWPVAAIGAVGGGLVLVAALRTPVPRVTADDGAPAGRPLAALARSAEARRRWLVIVLGVSIEFATLFWASTSVQELAGASSSVGAVGVGLFAAGMVTGRLAGPSLVRRTPELVTLRTSFAVAGAGALLLRLGPGAPGRLVGLAVAGAGVALLYPVSFARLYGPVPEASVGAVGALASGTAITLAPPALGALADALDLGWALLSIPAMAAMGLLLLGTDRDPAPPATER